MQLDRSHEAKSGEKRKASFIKSKLMATKK